MDFSLKKPTHLCALLGLIIALFVTVVVPIMSFFGFFGTVQSVTMENIPISIKYLFEIIALIIQIFLLVILIFIGVPWLWYTIVNNLSFKQMLAKLKLRFERIDEAFLWAIIVVIIGFGIFFVAGILLTVFGYDASQASNIPDIELIFSLPSIIILLVVQPIGEEIFFRGFLLDKIKSIAGKETAIITSGVLFGIAHLSHAKIYPALMTAILGIIFGYIVIKTRNLYTSIIAHILFNIISITFYFFGQQMSLESLIL